MYEQSLATVTKFGRMGSKRICKVCGRQISAYGLPWVSHGRSHVRKGQAIAFLDLLGCWDFVKPDQKPIDPAPKQEPEK